MERVVELLVRCCQMRDMLLIKEVIWGVFSWHRLIVGQISCFLFLLRRNRRRKHSYWNLAGRVLIEVSSRALDNSWGPMIAFPTFCIFRFLWSYSEHTLSEKWNSILIAMLTLSFTRPG